MVSEESKENHRIYMLTKVKCPCGVVTARSNMSKHRKTNKHQDWIEKNGGYEREELIDKIETLRSQLRDVMSRKII